MEAHLLDALSFYSKTNFYGDDLPPKLRPRGISRGGSALTGLACCIFPVAFRLSGGFVFDHPSYPVLLRRFSIFDFCPGSRYRRRFALGRFSGSTVLLRKLCLPPLSLTGFASLCNGLALCLLCFAKRCICLFSRAIRLKERGFGVCCSGSSVGNVAVSGGLQS